MYVPLRERKFVFVRVRERQCVCRCVCFWYLVASTEFGVPLEHRIGNPCVVVLSRRFSQYFDAFLRRLGSRLACKWALNWIGTGDA